MENQQNINIYGIKKGYNMLAVASGENCGEGKTWVAITLAHALSLLGQKVLLFDGDSGLSNIGNQLGIEQKNTLQRVLDKEKTLNQVIYHQEKSKLDIILNEPISGG